MNKKNDWFAANLNRPEYGLDDMFAAGLTPENTGLQNKDYYKSLDPVKKVFTDSTTQKFNDDAYNAFYDSVSRSYNEFSVTDFEKKWLESLESSPYDIFALDKPNAFDTTVRMVRNSDPQRHQVGISGVNIIGNPSWDEREVAQANFVRDENGNKLNWTPNGKWVTGALFGPTLALATWDENGVHEENGRTVTHRKGERKYDENGDPYYEILGNRSHYDKDVLHVTDVVTKDDSWINNLDFLDSDSLDKSIGKTIFKTAAQIGLWAWPHVGPVLGAVKAVKDFASVLPIVGKTFDSFASGDTNNKFGDTMTKWENFMARFDKSQTAYAQEKQWAFENIGDMISSSAGQLYSQRLIGQIPSLFNKKATAEQLAQLQKVGQTLSIGYMALTSAEDSYRTFKNAGASDAVAGLGFLGTAATYFGLMNNEYFKDWLFKDSAINFDPEMRFALRELAETEGTKIAKEVGLTTAKATSKEMEKEAEKFFAIRWWNALKKFAVDHKDKIPTGKAYPTTLAFANHALNEGIEETMEEAVVDTFKGITEAAQALGFNVTEPGVDKIDFGWSPEEILNRYLTSFVGGAVGGAVFEGLTRWENYWKSGGADRLLDKDAKNRIIWYLSNGQGKALREALDREHRKGHLGATNLTLDGRLTEDASGNATWTFNTASEGNNINDQMYYRISDAIDAIEWQAQQLNILDSDKEILERALASDELLQGVQKKIKEAAANEGVSEEEFMRKHRTSISQEYIAQSGVSDAVFSDVYWLKQRIMGLQKEIDDIIAKVQPTGDQDAKKSEAEERIKNNPQIKRLRDEQKKAQKEYDEILSGNRAEEYIGLGLFMQNNGLIKKYLNQEKFNRREYTMAMYQEVYDALSEDDQNSITSEYNQFLHDSNVQDDIRRAYRIHNRLVEQVNPTLAANSSELTGYSMDPSLTDTSFYTYLSTFVASLQTTLEMAKQQYEVTKDPEIEQTIKDLEDSIDVYSSYLNNPEISALTRAIDFDTEEGFQKKLPKAFAPNVDGRLETTMLDDLNMLEGYLKHLKENKIILAYENPIKNNVVSLAKQRIRNSIQEILKGYGASIAYDEEAQSLMENAIDVIDSGGLDLSAGDEIGDTTVDGRKLIEFFNAKAIRALRNESALSETEQAFLDRFADVTDEQLDQLETEYQELKDNMSSFNAKTSSIFKADTSKQKDVELLFTDLIENLDTIDDLKAAIEKAKQTIANQITDQETADLVIKQLFSDLDLFAEKYESIKSLYASLRPSPVTDLMKFLQVQIGDKPVPVLDFLEAEIKGLKTQEELDKYVLPNDYAVKQLQAVKNLIPIVQTIITSAIHGSWNTEMNLYRTGDPLVTLDEDQVEIYLHDLGYINDRINLLLEISGKHVESQADEQIKVAVNMQPKFVKFFTNVDSPIFKRLKDDEFGFGIDLADLWTKAKADTNVNESTVTTTNLADFMKVVFKWKQLIYDDIKAKYPTEIALTERFKKLLSKEGNNLITIGRDGGKYDADPETKVTSLGAMLYFMTIVGMDPSQLNGYIKSELHRDNDYPFDNQFLAIAMQVAGAQNLNIINAIVDAMDVSPEAKAKGESYVKNMSRLHNLIAVFGITGSGKSKVVTPFSINILKKINGNTEVLSTTKYNERLKELETEIPGSKIVNLDTLIEEAVGRALTPDDYENSQTHGHPTKLSDEFLSKLDISKLQDRFGKDSRKILNIDEGTFASEAELQIICYLAEKLNIPVLLSGDLHQQYAVRPYKEKPDSDTISVSSTGLEDCMYAVGPTLTTSMRSANAGMRQINIRFDTVIDKYVDILKSDPAEKRENVIPSDEAINLSLPNYIGSDRFAGGRIVDTDLKDWITKFDSYSQSSKSKKPRIGIISDNDSYDSLVSDNIVVIRPNNVQGQEFDYVVIDVDLNDPMYKSRFDRLKALNTWFGRARQGFVIKNHAKLDETGFSIKNETSDEKYSYSIDVKRDNAVGLEKYKDFVDSVYKDITVPETQSGSEANPTGPASSGTGSPSGSSSSSEKLFDSVVSKSEDFDKVRQKVIAEVLDPDNPKPNKSSHHDEENYRNHNALLNSKEKNNRYSLESFWRWLNSDESDDVIFGINSIFKPGTNEDATAKTKAKSIIQSIVYAIVCNTPTNNGLDPRRDAINSLHLDTELANLVEDPKQFDSDLRNSFRNPSWHAFSIRRYDDSHSIIWYVFQGSDKTYAVPLGLTTQWRQNTNFSDLDFKEYIPLSIISSDGQTSINANYFANKVRIHNKHYLFSPPRERDIYENLSEPAKKFRKSSGRLYTLFDLLFGQQVDSKNIEKSLSAKLDDRHNLVDFSQLTDSTTTRFGGVHRRTPYTQYAQAARLLGKAFNGQATDEERKTLVNVLEQLYPSASSERLLTVSKELGPTSLETVVNIISAPASDLNNAANVAHNLDKYEWLRRLEILNWESRANLFGALVRIANDWYGNGEPAQRKWAANFLGNVLVEHLRKEKDPNPSRTGNIYENGIELVLNGKDSNGYDKQVTFFIKQSSANNQTKFTVELVDKNKNKSETVTIGSEFDANVLDSDVGVNLYRLLNAAIAQIKSYSTEDISSKTITGLDAFDIKLDTDLSENVLSNDISSGTIQIIPASKRVYNIKDDKSNDKKERSFISYYVAGDHTFGSLLPEDESYANGTKSVEADIDQALKQDKVFAYGIYRGENRHAGVGIETGLNDTHFFYGIESNPNDEYTVDYVDMMLPAYNTDAKSASMDQNMLVNRHFQNDTNNTKIVATQDGERFTFDAPVQVKNEQLAKLTGQEFADRVFGGDNNVEIVSISSGINPTLTLSDGSNYTIKGNISEKSISDWIRYISGEIKVSNHNVIVNNNAFKVEITSEGIATYQAVNKPSIPLTKDTIVDIISNKHNNANTYVINDPNTGEEIWFELTDEQYRKMPNSFKTAVNILADKGTIIGQTPGGATFRYRNHKINEFVTGEIISHTVISIDENSKTINLRNDSDGQEWSLENEQGYSFDAFMKAINREGFKPENQPQPVEEANELDPTNVSKALQNIVSEIGVEKEIVEEMLQGLDEASDTFIDDVNTRLREYAPRIGAYYTVKIGINRRGRSKFEPVQDESNYAKAWIIINNKVQGNIVQVTEDNNIVQEFIVTFDDGRVAKYSVVFDKKGRYKIIEDVHDVNDPIYIVRSQIDSIQDDTVKSMLTAKLNTQLYNSELPLSYLKWMKSEQYREYESLINQIENLEQKAC